MVFRVGISTDLELIKVHYNEWVGMTPYTEINPSNNHQEFK